MVKKMKLNYNGLIREITKALDADKSLPSVPLQQKIYSLLIVQESPDNHRDRRIREEIE